MRILATMYDLLPIWSDNLCARLFSLAMWFLKLLHHHQNCLLTKLCSHLTQLNFIYLVHFVHLAIPSALKGHERAWGYPKGWPTSSQTQNASSQCYFATYYWEHRGRSCNVWHLVTRGRNAFQVAKDIFLCDNTSDPPHKHIVPENLISKCINIIRNTGTAMSFFWIFQLGLKSIIIRRNSCRRSR